MARKTKTPVRKAAVKTRKKAAAKKPAPKKQVRKRAPAKRGSAIERLENAIEFGAAELDDVAISMGLLGAVELPGKKPARKKKR